MDSYILKQSPKTKLLNAFRKAFTVPVLEKILVSLVLKSRNPFLLKLIPPDYLYPQGSKRQTARMGINYDLDISHVVDHAIYYGYPEDEMKIVEDTLKQATTIIDIGANIGAFSLHFARLNPKATILGFEPHPRTFARATRNIGLNQFSNIKLINLGLGKAQETVKLYEVNEHNPGMNRILATASDKPFVEIKIDTLDHVLAGFGIERVDFIKIDVEGYEMSVLEGATKTLASKPMMFIELDDSNLRDQGASAVKLINLLKASGYTEFWRADSNSVIDEATSFDKCHFDLIAR